MFWATDILFPQTLLTYFVPIIHNLPIFGDFLYKRWLWSINVSPGFVGSGIITGPAVSLHMLAGAIVGWAFLSPIAKSQGWARGPVEDWEHGSRGWIMWVSLAALLADCMIKLAWLVVRPVVKSTATQSYFRSWFVRDGYIKNYYAYSNLPITPTEELDQDDSSGHPDDMLAEDRNNIAATGSWPQHMLGKYATPDGGVRPWLSYALLLVSVLMCVLSVRYVFGDIVKVWTTIIAFIISLPLSIMGIRAVAETDWNPMSGIGKASSSSCVLIKLEHLGV